MQKLHGTETSIYGEKEIGNRQAYLFIFVDEP